MKRFLLLLLLLPVLAQGQDVNIPDPNFLAKLIAIGVDTNGDMVIQESEAAVPTWLYIDNAAINDLTGITAFTGIYGVDLSNNHVTTLNLNNMPHLTDVNADKNYLTNITLSDLPLLTKLIVSNNNGYTGTGLTPLLPSLQILDISGNSFTSIDLSGSALKEFYCTHNLLGNSINFGNFPFLLERIDCGSNGITDLNVILPNTNNFPSLKYLHAENNMLTGFDASGLAVMEELNVSGNAGLTSLNLSGLANLKKLECSQTNLGSLSMIPNPNFEYLDCNDAHLSYLNVSGLTNLKDLNCGNNNLTELNVSGLQGLTRLVCLENEIDHLDISGLTALIELYAFSAGFSTLTLGQNTNLELLDIQNDNLTLLDLSACPNLTKLWCSGNSLTSLDLSQSPLLNQCMIVASHLTTLDLSNNPQITFLNVHNNTFLETIFMKNGTTIQTGWFSLCPALTYICTDEAETEVVANMLVNSTNTTATANSYCSFVPGSIHNTITGTARFDFNQDGCSSTDPGLRFVKVNITDGLTSGMGFTSHQGNYNFFVQSGTYTVMPALENPGYFNVDPSFATAVFNELDSSTSNHDFCLTATGVNPDLEIVVAPVIPARPGFDAVYKMVYRNKGNQVMSQLYGVSFFYNQNLAAYVSANVAPSTNGPGGLTWDYTGLNPFESRSITVTLHINAPTDTANPVNIGDVLDFNAVISPVGGDAVMVDNYCSYHQTVVGAFDPNDIYCVEGDTVPPSAIGQYLHYIINFENTGNYPAENVVVKEVIDTAKFDLSSLQFMDSSHPVDIRVHDNIAEMIFQDINLDTGGHGNVMLKIKSKGDLVSGDMVSKKASIYFDYNAPVTTNMANTIFQSLNLPGAIKDASITVFPVPASGFVTIKADSPIISVEVYDVAGRLIQVVRQNEPQLKLDISGQAPGTYFLKILTEHGMLVEKAVKK